MPVSIPNAIPYRQPLMVLPDRWMDQKPPEGPQQIPCEILWGDSAYTGTQKAVKFSIYGGAAQTISRIKSLSIDNSDCGCAIQFVFSDTQETLSIPAYSPRTICPVFTNGLDFYVITKGQVLSSDVTRFSIHNTTPPPIAVPFTQEQAVAASGALNVTFPSTNILLAAGNRGTIENGNISIINTIQGGGSWVGNFLLRDGDNKTLARVICNGDGANDFYENAVLWQVDGVHLRFNNGLFIDQAVIGASFPAPNQAFLNVNLYYRTP